MTGGWQLLANFSELRWEMGCSVMSPPSTPAPVLCSSERSHMEINLVHENLNIEECELCGHTVSRWQMSHDRWMASEQTIGTYGPCASHILYMYKTMCNEAFHSCFIRKVWLSVEDRLVRGITPAGYPDCPQRPSRLTGGTLIIRL